MGCCSSKLPEVDNFDTPKNGYTAGGATDMKTDPSRPAGGAGADSAGAIAAGAAGADAAKVQADADAAAKAAAEAAAAKADAEAAAASAAAAAAAAHAETMAAAHAQAAAENAKAVGYMNVVNGWLEKRGAPGLLGSAPWNRRYVCLSPGELTYWHSREEYDAHRPAKRPPAYLRNFAVLRGQGPAQKPGATAANDPDVARSLYLQPLPLKGNEAMKPWYFRAVDVRDTEEWISVFIEHGCLGEDRYRQLLRDPGTASDLVGTLVMDIPAVVPLEALQETIGAKLAASGGANFHEAVATAVQELVIAERAKYIAAAKTAAASGLPPPQPEVEGQQSLELVAPVTVDDAALEKQRAVLAAHDAALTTGTVVTTNAATAAAAAAQAAAASLPPPIATTDAPIAAYSDPAAVQAALSFVPPDGAAAAGGAGTGGGASGGAGAITDPAYGPGASFYDVRPYCANPEALADPKLGLKDDLMDPGTDGTDRFCYAGYMRKKGEGALATYKTRWLVLKKGYMLYYDSETSRKPGALPNSGNFIPLSRYRLDWSAKSSDMKLVPLELVAQMAAAGAAGRKLPAVKAGAKAKDSADRVWELQCISTHDTDRDYWVNRFIQHGAIPSDIAPPVAAAAAAASAASEGKNQFTVPAGSTVILPGAPLPAGAAAAATPAAAAPHAAALAFVPTAAAAHPPPPGHGAAPAAAAPGAAAVAAPPAAARFRAPNGYDCSTRPSVWEICETADGLFYYYHLATGVPQWTLPDSDVPTPAEGGAATAASPAAAAAGGAAAAPAAAAAASPAGDAGGDGARNRAATSGPPAGGGDDPVYAAAADAATFKTGVLDRYHPGKGIKAASAGFRRHFFELSNGRLCQYESEEGYTKGAIPRKDHDLAMSDYILLEALVVTGFGPSYAKPLQASDAGRTLTLQALDATTTVPPMWQLRAASKEERDQWGLSLLASGALRPAMPSELPPTTTATA